jgi:MraZ protein
LRNLLLVGEFELSVDDKSRMLVPSEIRKSLDPERDGDLFYLVVGVNRKPWLYVERTYEEMVARAPSEIPEDEMLAYDQVHFGMAAKVEMDKQGRILIPDKTIRRTGLKKEVTLIGVRDHLELWNREDWNEHSEALFDRLAEVSLRARQARKAAMITPGS